MILKNSVVVWEPNGIFKINRNKHVSGFSNILTFAPKSDGKLLLVILIWMFFLSQAVSDLFKTIERSLEYSNLSYEEWNAIRSLADNKNSI